MKKPKTTSVTAQVIGAVTIADGPDVQWKARLKVPRLPFYLDSAMRYQTLAQAEAEAEKWRGRKVVVTVTK